MTAIVKIGKKVAKASKTAAQFFNCKITDTCSVQSAGIFVGASLSVLLQNSTRYLKENGDLNI